MMQNNYTSGQVARLLGIPPRTIRAYLANGRLHAEQNPATGRWRVTREQVIGFMRDNGIDTNALGQKANIMVVARDENRYRILQQALQDGPWRCDFSDSCAKALISMGAKPPDLLVLDHWAAQDHCQELVETIRGHERTESVPILLLSVPKDIEEIVQPDAVIDDPEETTELREKIEALLSR